MLAGSVAGNLAFHSYFRIGMNRSILSVTFKQRPQVFPTVERFSPTVCLPTGDSRGLIGCLHLSLLYDCPQDSACYQRLPLWMVYQQLNLLTPTIYPNTPACFTCSGFHVVSRIFISRGSTSLSTVATDALLRQRVLLLKALLVPLTYPVMLQGSLL